ncbi:lamin tail domain-containing protein, partial [Akkermansiaceae bacterium]|nr:lamin tail domain-containing protein [Akkermansiaceae bacterium]
MNIKKFAAIKSLLPFGCAAILGTIPATAEQVIFTEIQYNAKAGDPDFLEITNITGTPLDMGKWYFSDGIDYTFPDFSSADPGAHIFKQFETILVSPVDEATLRAAYPGIPAETRIFGPYTGALSNSGETLTLNDKNGGVMTTIEYNDGGKWPAAADGTGHTLTRINPNLSNAEWRNWAASEQPGGTPGRGPANEDDLPTFTTEIAQTTSTWKYDQNEANLDRGTAWRESDFDDSSWSTGAGVFGKNSTDPFATPWTTGGRITYYLRSEFQFDELFSSATIDIESHLDDGVVFYLNGQEITRFNMPPGAINFDTPASSGREWQELVEIASGTDISSALRTGLNVLAVEVHNRTAGSSDIAFGANINITATESLSAPLPNLVISEIHFGEDDQIDWVELHAPGSAPVSVSGLALATTRSLTNAVDLNGSVPA